MRNEGEVEGLGVDGDGEVGDTGPTSLPPDPEDPLWVPGTHVEYGVGVVPSTHRVSSSTCGTTFSRSRGS